MSYATKWMIHKQNIQDNLNAIMGLISFTTAETILQDTLNVQHSILFTHFHNIFLDIPLI